MYLGLVEFLLADSEDELGLAIAAVERLVLELSRLLLLVDLEDGSLLLLSLLSGFLLLLFLLVVVRAVAARVGARFLLGLGLLLLVRVRAAVREGDAK